LSYNAEAIVDNIDLGECVGVLHQLRKMPAARNQVGQIQHILTSVTGEAHPQPSLTAWLGLLHHCDVTGHPFIVGIYWVRSAVPLGNERTATARTRF
jgi:hypothetical protein